MLDITEPVRVATKATFSGRSQYESIVKRDRTDLLIRQLQIHEQKSPVYLLISGSQTSGYARIINHLNEWMDARFIQTHVHQPDTDEEHQRPFFWKYWRQSPPKGEIGLFLGGWYTDPYLDRLIEPRDEEHFQHQMQEIRETERLWAEDGALVVKIWLHLDQDDKRRNKQGKRNNRPHDTWQVTMDDWRGDHSYEEKMALVQRVFSETHHPDTPWFIVDASDSMLCNLTVMHLLTDLFEYHLQKKPPRPSLQRVRVDGKAPHADEAGTMQRHKEIDPGNSFETDGASTPPLNTIDLSKSLSRSRYEEKMKHLWESLYLKSWESYDRGQSLVIVFEGSDAAGKGGAIRRLTRCMDARLYRVIQTAAPTALEHAHHYLWRFWMQIPRQGKITIYDRSWYGRVLVERVEGFADPAEWQRAYREINEFERQLCRSNTRILKFWLQISPEEQLKRFRKREKTPYKEFKLTDEDWRNREKLDHYEAAVNDMIRKTNTDVAPWHLISAENKRHARIQVLETVEKAFTELASGCA